MEAKTFSEKYNPKKHPQESSNLLSNLFFCWTFRIFRTGLKKELTEDDVYRILKRHDCSRLANKLEKIWHKEMKENVKPSLWKAIWKLFKWEILVNIGIFFILECIIRIARPLALGRLLGYYVPNQTETSKNDAIIYASIIIIASFLESVITQNWFIHVQQIAIRVRVALSSMVYRKSLKLSKKALGETTVGHIINLLSNDMQQIASFWSNFHSAWSTPFQAILIMYLLYSTSGATSLVGIVFIIVLTPIQLFISKKLATYRLRIALKTDERLKHMTEIVSGIQVIKVYTWEQPFIKVIDIIRRKEISLIKIANYLDSVTRSLAFFVDRTSIFLSILAYVLLGNVPTAQYVYVVSSFYLILMEAISLYLPQAVSVILQANVSIKRLENFLKLDEIQNDNLITNRGVIKVEKVSAKWADAVTLSDINFEIQSGEVVAVIGPIGSGKSSLLQLCLGEISLISGTVKTGFRVSYAHQEPWLFAGSIKQNILFGQVFDNKKYQEVIKVCGLEEDISSFPYGDSTIVGERGILLSGGQKARINLARAVYKDADIYLLDDPLSAVDASVGKQIFNQCIMKYLAGKSVVLVTHQIQYLTYVDKIYLMTNGTIEASGSYSDLKSSGKDFAQLLNRTESCDNEEATYEDAIVDKKETEEQEEEAEIEQKGKVSRKTYTSYVRSGGSYLNFLLLAILFIFLEISATGSDYYVTFWVNLEQERMSANVSTNGNSSIDTFFTEENCIYIYTAMIAALIIFAFSSSMLFIRTSMVASIRLHNKMFSSIINATMRFFYTTSSGRILNRFSKDIGGLDEVLPDMLLDIIELSLSSFATILAVCIVSPWSLLPTLIVFLVMYQMRRVFLASSIPIKRMENKNRSPIFAHLTESIKGLTTIRACGATNILEKEFDNHQNVHTSIYYMYLSTNRAFGTWLDSLCVTYVLFVTIIALIQETYGGNIGFVITQGMSLTGMIQWGIRRWSDLENQMTSVERVFEYIGVDVESTSKKEPPVSWPEFGKIEFRSVFMKYSPNEQHVLKNLNVVIQSREKIGIVGRTGAGKSSLISVLFRLVEFEGAVLIDGVDTKEISLSSLRSKISIIPQEPILFSGSVRKNLDPFDQYPDDLIWKVLEEVKLKEFIVQLPAGLQSNLSEGGSNFSAGQKQLICLARALLRDNKILMLDEATANVDPQTDELLQQTIRKNFAECTVLTIAHRLHTVMDSDKVLVMDDGQIAEFDHPYTLLKNKGVFYDLVLETGKKMSENLLEIAQKNYKNKQD